MAEKIFAVIGAGTIGADVVFDLAINNFSVVLEDLSNNILEKAKERIKNSYRFAKMMKKNTFFPLLVR